MTPIGEPLSTITVSKLNESFFYLFDLLGIPVIILVVIFGVLSALFVKKPGLHKAAEEMASTDSETKPEEETATEEVESYGEIVFRSLKIYLFVMALTFLGAGFEPFIERYLLDLSPLVLYWINMVSAILDNATLAAAEISPAMSQTAINDILMGLMISGGMLIPGNIPNIIAAGKLKITSSEYAKFAVPVGLVTMAGYFVFILLFS